MEDQANNQNGTSGLIEQKQDILNPLSVSIPPSGSEGSITWTASEFIEHQKKFSWYIWLLIISCVVAFLVFLLTKDAVAVVTIMVSAVVFGLMAAKKPKEQIYKIDTNGFYVGEKLFPFSSFRSFAVSHNGAFSSLVFIPLKRFSLLVTAYYDPADEDKILALLSSYLPMEEKKKDLIEELMWKLRY